MKFDPELFYIGAMFHDMRPTPEYSSKSDRFEVDGANVARAFLYRHNIPPQEIDTVWTALALRQTLYGGIKHKFETTFGNVRQI